MFKVVESNSDSINRVNSVSGGSNVNNLNSVCKQFEECRHCSSVNIVNSVQVVYRAVLPPSSLMKFFLSTWISTREAFALKVFIAQLPLVICAQ